jgi:ABC-type bacteriocin/lantibiotic exporter with double-glycine peptidase domain
MKNESCLPSNYQTRYPRVEQSHPFDCWAACIAMVANKTIDAVTDLALRAKILPEGPYCISDDAIAKLFIRYGFVSTIYKATSGNIDELPDLCMVLLSYDENTELGHHALMYRERELPASPNRCVLIDPAGWVLDSKRVRILEEGEASYFIGITEVQYSTDY